MCEADSLILHSFGVEGRVNRTFIVILDATLDVVFNVCVWKELFELLLLESLILAQDERWRRA
jgi:hypothetical protein